MGAALVALALPAPASAELPPGNVVVNPGAQVGNSSPDYFASNPPPNWTPSGATVTQVQYDPTPAQAPPRPIGGGAANTAFFAGGSGATSRSMFQVIDLSGAAPEIDTGKVLANLTAELGGFAGQLDRAQVVAEFRRGDDSVALTMTAPAITASDRQSQTKLMPSAADPEKLPGGVRTVILRVDFLFDGSGGTTYNDGYADNISLSFSQADTLVFNPGAELGPAFSDTTTSRKPPLWLRTGTVTQHLYAGDGFPGQAVSAAIAGGNAFFAGGRAPSSTMSQQIEFDAPTLAAISAGNTNATLSAYLGGYADQNDRAGLTVTFWNRTAGDSQIVGTLDIPAVTAADRAAASPGDPTTLLYREVTGPIPATTDYAVVEATFSRQFNSEPNDYNDGYVDKIRLELTGVPTVPETTIDGAQGFISDTTPSFTVGAVPADGATFACKLTPGDADFGPCPPGPDYGPLADGTYRLEARATRDGVTDPTPAQRFFTIDTGAPTATIVSDPSSGISDDGFLLQVSGQDSGTLIDEIRCVLNPVQEPVLYSQLPSELCPWRPFQAGPAIRQGRHVIYAAVKDAAGNISSIVSRVLIAGPAPTTVITGGPSGRTNDDTPTFAFTSNQSTATFECELDPTDGAAGTPFPCSSPYTFEALAQKSYIFGVTAISEIGRRSGGPQSRLFTVDLTAPPPPPPGPGPGPGPAPGPTPIAGNPPPAARIAKPLIGNGQITFDASETVNATTFKWDLTGDGKTDVDCGTRPQVATTVDNVAQGRSATLIAAASDGRSDTANVAIPKLAGALAGARRPEARAAAPTKAQYADNYLCSGTRPALIDLHDLTEQGGPPAGCNVERIFGVVAAVGCLRKVSDTFVDKYPQLIAALKEAVVGNPELVAHLNSVDPSVFFHPQLRARRAALKLDPKRLDIEKTLQLGAFYSSDKPVRINGIDFYPRGGSDIVISDLLRLVYAPNAAVRAGKMLIRQGATVVDVSESRGRTSFGNSIPFAEIDFTGQLAEIGGFPIQPRARVSFVKAFGLRYSSIEATANLTKLADGTRSGMTLAPDVHDPPLTARATLVADNRTGLSPKPLSTRLPLVYFGQWPVKDVEIAYGGPRKAGAARKARTAQAPIKPDNERPLICNLDAAGLGQWSFVGDLLVGGLADYGLHLAPPPFNGICFEDGRFKSAGATLEFGATPKLPPVPIVPGVFLDEVGFNLAINPSVFRGRAKVSLVKILQVDGRIVAAFPSGRSRFEFRKDDIPGLPPSVLNAKWVDPVFAVGGTLRVPAIPAIGDLANAHFLFSTGGQISIGARFEKDFFGVVYVNVGTDAQINLKNGRYNFNLNGSGCLIKKAICGGVVGAVSNVGMGACVEALGLRMGGGFQWPDSAHFWFPDGCKWTRFTEDNVFALARASQAQQPYVVNVAKGGPSRTIQIDGREAAPAVKVTGPDGETLELSGTDLKLGRHIRGLRAEPRKFTAIGLIDPLPGAYKIEPLPGSSAWAKTSVALDAPDAKITTKLSGRGANRVLSYDILRRPDQTVQFVDGGRILREIKGGGKGVLKLALPSDAATHEIVARFLLNGIAVPGEDRVVARIRTPKRQPLGRPASLSVRRRGAALAVRWGTAPGAVRYSVIVYERGGRTRTILTRKRTLRIRGVSITQAGTVTVSALDSINRAGPSRRAAYRAIAKPRTRFRPISSVGKR